MKSFSPYQICWVEFQSAKGVVTKHDEKAMKCLRLSCDKSRAFRHFRDKQSAIDFLVSVKGKRLNKSYSCRIFSDKQFGMMNGNDMKPAFTKKQLNEVYYL